MKQRGLIAALWMILAGIGMALISGIIKHLSATLPPLEIVFFRNFFGLIALAPWFWQNGIEGLRTKRVGLLSARAAAGLISTTCWFLALAVIPLADATALTFTAPLFATFGAVFFLSEVVHLRRWVATLIGFAGAMVVLRPGFQEFRPESFYVILAAASLAFSSIVIKKLTTTESPTKCVAWAHLLMTPVSLVPALFVWEWPLGTTWLWLIGLGGLTALAHLSLTRAIGMSDVSAVMPYDFLRLPFAALVGYFAFSHIPDLWTWIGAGIIFLSAFYITRRETKAVPQLP